MSSEQIAFISPDSTPSKMAQIASAPPASNGDQPVIWVPKDPSEVPLRRKAVRTDSNKYTDRAKQLVVDNYNAHHDKDKTPPLTPELVYVVWFSKVLNDWKAIIGSSVVKGLLYEVTYNGTKGEAYIDVYKKINNVKIAD